MTAGRIMGLDRSSAARFSLLLSLPIIGGAGIFKGLKVAHNGGLPPGFAGPFFWGTVASAISGFLVIWALLAFLRRGDFKIFMIYRIAVAILVFAVIIGTSRGATIG